MTADERRALQALRELPPTDEGTSDDFSGDVGLYGILDGSEPLNISHAGGELQAFAEEIMKT